MIDVLNNLIKNWKTSLLGVAGLALVVMMLAGRVTPEQFLTGLGTIVGGGLLAAKDGNVTGK